MCFSRKIISWYRKTKRPLPWRSIKNPYKIWLSEIILQQTRVQQGLPYYEKFIKEFPTVHHLASVSQEKVLKCWQGLGYYSRAENLHRTAKFISGKLNGKFPRDYKKLLQMKGIGSYTAAAIASFAFNKPHAVVDGNVFRVLSRYFGITMPMHSLVEKKFFLQKAESLLDKKHPGLFNQAIMEFGALQCVPQNPVCSACILKKTCVAFAKNLVHRLPIKRKLLSVKKRHFNYLVFHKNGKILMKKRTGKDIWKNLYDFPLIETAKNISAAELMRMSGLKKTLRKKTIQPLCRIKKYVLSHQTVFIRFWSADFKQHNENSIFRNSLLIPENQLLKIPLPEPVERFFEEFFKNKK